MLFCFFNNVFRLDAVCLMFGWTGIICLKLVPLPYELKIHMPIMFGCVRMFQVRHALAELHITDTLYTISDGSWLELK